MGQVGIRLRSEIPAVGLSAVLLGSDIELRPYRNGDQVPPSEDDQCVDLFYELIVEPVGPGGLACRMRRGGLE